MTANIRLADKSFASAEFRYNRWSADLEGAQTVNDALEPYFWAGIADRIRGHDKSKGVGDIIEVRKRETGLYAELLITEIGVGYVRTVLLRSQEPKVDPIPDDVPLTARWNLGKKQHEVIRKADKQLMQGGFQTRAAAVAWIADHMKAMAA